VRENVNERTAVAPAAASRAAIVAAAPLTSEAVYVTASRPDVVAAGNVARRPVLRRTASLPSVVPVRAIAVDASLDGHTNAAAFGATVVAAVAVAAAMGVAVGAEVLLATLGTADPPPPPHAARVALVVNRTAKDRARTREATRSP
jgi:hypothetical protein